MLRSMTAFSREEAKGDWGRITWEIRTVNHRYLDVTVRMPEELRALEGQIRELAGDALQRGKLECNLRYNPSANVTSDFTVNDSLVDRLLVAAAEIDKKIPNPEPLSALNLLRWPGVISEEEPDQTELQQQTLVLFKQCLKQLIHMREREGVKLADLISMRCDMIEEFVDTVKLRRPLVVEKMREKVLSKLAELDLSIDEGRFEQELAIQAQRLDVEEELDRLHAHISEVRRVLSLSEPVGRRLDFLMQELNREANTLSSKSNDADTTRAAVDIKVLIEQMREQVQNIE